MTVNHGEAADRQRFAKNSAPLIRLLRLFKADTVSSTHKGFVSGETIDFTTDEILKKRNKEMNPMFDIFKSIFLALLVALLLGACATINWDYPRTPSKAFANPE